MAGSSTGATASLPVLGERALRVNRTPCAGFIFRPRRYLQACFGLDENSWALSLHMMLTTLSHSLLHLTHHVVCRLIFCVMCLVVLTLSACCCTVYSVSILPHTSRHLNLPHLSPLAAYTPLLSHTLKCLTLSLPLVHISLRLSVSLR